MCAISLLAIFFLFRFAMDTVVKDIKLGWLVSCGDSDASLCCGLSIKLGMQSRVKDPGRLGLHNTHVIQPCA